jgi:mannose-binding lectin 2
MPNTAYLGFSAETGELSDNFDIVTVETRNMYQSADPRGRQGGDRGSRRGGRGRPEKTGGSWTWFFFRVILFFGLVGGSYVGYTMYRANKRNSRF